jgi:hypothetical protein
MKLSGCAGFDAGLSYGPSAVIHSDDSCTYASSTPLAGTGEPTAVRVTIHADSLTDGF